MDRGKKENKAGLIIVKVACFIISFMIWIYIFISLNPVINTKIYNIPVNVINSSSLKERGLIVLPDQKFTVNLNVKGSASDIYNLKQENFEIFLDLSLYELDKGENIVRSYAKSVPQNITITKPNDLDVKVLIDDFVEKRIIVDKNIEKNNADGFYSFDPKITPEHVVISGAAKYVNEVDKALAGSKFEDLKQDTYQSLKVKLLDKSGKEINKFVDVYPDVVEMYIMVRAVKNVEVEVPFVNNLGENLKLESVDIIPKEIKIIGSKEVISNIFKIYSESVDLSKVDGNSILEVPLKDLNEIETVDNIRSVTIKIKISKIENDENK